MSPKGHPRVHEDAFTPEALVEQCRGMAEAGPPFTGGYLPPLWQVRPDLPTMYGLGQPILQTLKYRKGILGQRRRKGANHLGRLPLHSVCS